MNYPIWEITRVGGGTVIALIAVFHVFISHLAVGGGLFLWLTDRRASKTGDVLLADYVRRHTWFFLLLTMVLGGMTGVGIWFIIALVQPAATSALIHTFVFAWAIEWVFFVVEIVALLIYHYRFAILAESDRHRIAFLYFLFAWLSLVVINGILTFMLTPGKWLETKSIADGFFNPTNFPALCFRSFIAVIIAGLFGYVTAVFTPDQQFRNRLMAYCSKWVILPLVGLVPSATWYYFALPEDIRVRSFSLNPQTLPFVHLFFGTTLILFVAGVLLMQQWSLGIQRIATACLLLIGLGWIGGFEYTREISRKPFVIGDYMYVNGIKTEDILILNREGVLRHARWSQVSKINSVSPAEAGQELFRIECLGCHTINGIRNDIVLRVKNFTAFGLLAQLTGQGKIQTYMPPFVGTNLEKEALVAYLTTKIMGLKSTIEPAMSMAKDSTVAVPPFDVAKSDYVLLAWSDRGMHDLSDGDAWFSYLPPGNTLEAQIIKRGDPPKLMPGGIELSYDIEEGFDRPSLHSEFWKHAESLMGNKPEANHGFSGKGLHGVFDFDSTHNSFVAAGLPVVPYKDDASYNAYPIFTLEAHNRETGKLLATTKVISPVSSEIGCRNCHGGDWRVSNSGFSDETAIHILSAHDRLNGTTLVDLAKAGKPQLCQSCHPDPGLPAAGKRGVTDFATAMHGFHASYMPFDDSWACALCHPNTPSGNTRFLRDLHGHSGLGCIDCHGSLAENAIALLKSDTTNSSARRLLAPLGVKEKGSITPRMPWTGETDCLNCHKDFERPAPGSRGFNGWTKEAGELYRVRADNVGVRCPACHGSTHALYPSKNEFSRDRDNLQPLQYSGSRAPIGANQTCVICHRKPMPDAIHHPNMVRPMRNLQLLR